MTGFAGRSEFFSREAGDYLRELGPLVSGGTPPPGDAFARLARALRGAAMLAGPQSYTRAAREFEQVAKRVSEGSLGWPEAGPLLQAAVAEFQRLTGFAQSWDDARDDEALALEARLKALAAAEGQPSEHRTGPDGLRAFVGRELSALAAALNRGATAVATDPGTAGPALASARAAMQSLLGLAGLGELHPLDDVLEVLDSLLTDLARHPSVPPEAAKVLERGAAALRSLADDVAHHGRPRELATIESLVDGVFDQFASGEGTVPVDALLLPGAERPLPGSPAPPAADLDLATLGERLRSGAAQIRTAASPLVGLLRRYCLLAAIRGAPGGLGREPAGAFLARLAGCLERRTTGDEAMLVRVIDQAGELLSAGTDRAGLAVQLGALAAQLAGEETVVPVEDLAPDETEPVPIEALAPELEETVVPIEWLAPDEEAPTVPIEALAPDDGVVPIEDLAPEEELPIVPIEALLAPAAEARATPPPPAPFPGLAVPADRTRLELALSAYSRLMAANAPVLPLEALIPPAVPPVRPAGSRSAAIEIEAEFDVVPIEALLYRGSGAMHRADDLRRQLEEALKAASTELDRVEPLVRELLDLVPLAVTNGR